MSMHEFFYGERESMDYNYVHYEHLYPTTFDLMGREAAPVHGYYRERAEAFGSGASSSCNDGATFTWKSSRVQQGNSDRRSYVDTRDSPRYARTVCPGYRGSPAVTHYVSVNPAMATRVESGVAWSS